MKLTYTMLGLFLTANLLRAEVVPPNDPLTEREQQIVAAAESATQSAPRFNGALVVGIHPNTPLIYSLAVSGQRPMTFNARHLPTGLTLDQRTGIINGSVKRAGEYKFIATAKNSMGETKAEIKIVAGDTLALTPPLGWNSYDNFGDAVTEAEALTNATWLKQHLQP